MDIQFGQEEAHDQTKLGMRFCSECNNMLYPKENKAEKKLEFICRRCNNKETVDRSQYCVYRNDIKASKTGMLNNIEWGELVNDPTLPRTRRAELCPNCKNSDAVILQTGFGTSSTGSGGMTLWLICTKCTHRWNGFTQQE
jgi:DNA-directed RNA polymerase II subunit RPB9